MKGGKEQRQMVKERKKDGRKERKKERGATFLEFRKRLARRDRKEKREIKKTAKKKQMNT